MTSRHTLSRERETTDRTPDDVAQTAAPRRPVRDHASAPSPPKRKRGGFLPVLLVAGLILSGIAWRSTTASSTPAVSFRTVPLERGDLLITISATGTVEPEEVVNVGAQVAGMIREFGTDPADPAKTVDYGTVVHKGTVLARIDDAPYRAAVARAQAQVAHAEAGVQQADAQVLQAQANAERSEADIEQLQAKLSLAELDFARAQRLKNGAISAADYETAESSLRSARAGLGVGRATLGQTKAAIDDAKANVLKMRAAVADAKVALETAEINLGYCTIKSPVDGSIIDRRVNVGQTVVASLNAPSLFLIAKDLNKVQVWTSVNEADIGKVRKGLKVRFRVDAHPDKVFEGETTQVRLNAMMTQNVVTYTVVATAENSEGLLPYLTANVDIEVDQRKDVLLVPNGALRWQPEQGQIHPDHRDAARPNEASERNRTGPAKEGMMWVTEGPFVRPIPVRMGLSDGSHTEVAGEGLSEAIPVVTGVDQAAAAARSGNPFIPQIPGKKKTGGPT